MALEQGIDYVYLLNHDAYLIEPIIEPLIDLFNTYKDVGIVSPFHLGESETKLESQFEKFMFQQGIIGDVYKDLIFTGQRGIYEVDFIPAASWFIDVKQISTIGLFNELFYHYGEDNNYLQRVKYWKLKILVTNKVHLVHIGNKVKRSFLKNYRGFHLLSVKARYLTEFLNINSDLSLIAILINLLKDLKFLILSLMKLKFYLSWNITQVIIWKLKMSKHFKLQSKSQKIASYGFSKLLCNQITQ
jgi:GT2 family glycosyltransferase